MTDSVIQPRFIPWLRQGLAAHITDVAVGGMATTDRTSASVTVTAHGTGPGGDRQAVVPSPAISLAGPGDVVGLGQSEVLHRYPAPGADDAEPNYFVHIEFVSPDLPWRYTPAAAAETDERLQPWLALVVVPDQDGFTLGDGAGGRLPVLTIYDQAASQLPPIDEVWAWAHTQAEHDLADGVAEALNTEPSRFRSRLICPRQLQPNRSWIACVVPTFEVGRLAGLGSSSPATRLGAWSDDEDGQLQLPVYSSWRFSTGPVGDFESLVRRLQPRTLPASVGRRTLDLRQPGGGLTPNEKAVTSYEGALLSPVEGGHEWDPDHREMIKNELTDLVNATAVKRSTPANYNALRDDPVIGPPAWAAPQVGQRHLPKEGGTPVWFRQLNTEPHHRAVAGLGAEVIRNDQEALMDVAWNNLGDTKQANQILGMARLAWEVGTVATAKLQNVGDDRLIQLAGPALHRCKVAEGQTLKGAVLNSDLPDGLVSGPLRRLSHSVPGMTVRAQGPEDGPEYKYPLTDLITNVAMTDPVGLVSTWSEIKIPPGTDPAGLTATTRPTSTSPATSDPTTEGPGGQPRSTGSDRGPRLTEADLGPRLRRLQNPPDRTVTVTRPSTTVGVPHRPAAQPVDSLADDIRTTLDSPAVVKSMVSTRLSGVTIDTGASQPVPVRVTAEPLFTTAMYRRLNALSVDYLVPGIGDVPDDTLGLLEVNRPFIESFMAGLNHEMSREIRWREYPARLDRTWFQQFWDTVTPNTFDITPIDRWAEKEELGANRPGTTTEVGLVLLLKGALPRRYPDLRVYAVEATWAGDKRRENTDADAIVHQPLFTGTLGPGAHFYGFAVTEEQANGSTDPNNHPGYFFVLEEQIGRPRFGLDTARQNEGGVAPSRWSNLRWSHLRDTGQPIPTHVETSGPSWLIDAGPLPGNGGRDQWGDDAAAMARITLQRPVRMLVHASAMLPDSTSEAAVLSKRIPSPGPAGRSIERQGR